MLRAASLLLLLSNATAVAQVPTTQNYAPQPAQTLPSIAYSSPTGEERMKWFLNNTVGPASLSGGALSCAWSTLFNEPKEYGPHWGGFAKRYGMRLTGVATSNAMETGFGSLWGEDPRYFRTGDGSPFKSRLYHVIKMTAMATNREGRVMPAYARYIAIPGSNYLSNTWRADSEAGLDDAASRTLFGFLSKMSGNAWDEFWPDLKQRVFKKGAHPKP